MSNNVVVVQRLIAPRRENGTPRKLVVGHYVSDGVRVKSVVTDEGYEGEEAGLYRIRLALEDLTIKVVRIPQMNIPGKEYRELLKGIGGYHVTTPGA